MSNKSVVDLIKEEGLLDEKKINDIMQPANLTGPSSLISESKVKVDKSHTHLRESSVMNMDFLGKVFAPGSPIHPST